MTLLRCIGNVLRHVAVLLAILTGPAGLPVALAGEPVENITTLTHYWVDESGQARIGQVAQLPRTALQWMDKPKSFELTRGALWLRYELPELDVARRWFILLEGPSYTNRATLYQQDGRSQWHEQNAGDTLPMSQWSRPDLAPTFNIYPIAGQPIWLRLENAPSSLNPGLTLLDESKLETRRNSTLLFIGGYLGFGLLVLFLGWVHARLYADRAFVAYVAYVTCMLGFQVSFTGLGALFFWPEMSHWSDASPAVFVCWLTASGIWFVREVAALYRHHRAFNRFVMLWSLVGLVYPAVYLTLMSPLAFKVLNLYGALSVLLSMAVCLWAWRKGEVYAGWTALGFLPLHLAYPFAALRATGAIPDGWFTQHAVLIGSAFEIPLLLYILHRRARDFSENRARMRAIDSTDPLTGLTISPVLILRLRDALKRARRNNTHCGLAMVELGNHADLVAEHGRQAGDRALVVAASQLTSLVRDVDTVCRISESRFAVLLESPYKAEMLNPLAQHIVARGLGHQPFLPRGQALRFRVITLALPDPGQEQPPAEELDVQLMIDRLQQVLDKVDRKRIIVQLPLPAGTPPDDVAAGC